MRSLIVLTLLATTAAPVLAQAPPPAATPALSSTIPTILLDSLRGKNQIVGITKTNGTRYLCRIKAGDHGQYIAQEFHFAGPPRTHSETVPASTGNPVPHTKRVTVGSGRGRHTVSVTTYSPGGVIKAHKVETKTDTIIPDDQAVRFLLAGVAGSLRSPREIEGPEDMLTPADVKYLQTLSPPPPPAATVTPPAAGTATTTAPKSAWVMATLWPATIAAASGSTTAPAPKPARSHRGRPRAQ